MILDNSTGTISHFEPTPTGPAPSDPGAAPPPETRQSEPAFRIPPATGWLIGLNVAVHVARQFLPAGQDDVVVNLLGFDPGRLRDAPDLVAILSLVTYQFLHGGWDHLVINMITLLAFGPGIERPLGRSRFIIIYLLSGIAGALLEGVFAPAGSDDLLIGASASISGVFGALLIFWRFHQLGKRPLGIVRLALLWVVMMAVTGIFGVGANGVPVAWIAHIGGFLAGMALVRPISAGLGRP
jgi:membrane associated rhomboid family serine protease